MKRRRRQSIKAYKVFTRGLDGTWRGQFGHGNYGKGEHPRDPRPIGKRHKIVCCWRGYHAWLTLYCARWECDDSPGFARRVYAVQVSGDLNYGIGPGPRDKKVAGRRLKIGRCLKKG